MKRTIAALLALLVAFAMVLTGCGDSPAVTTTSSAGDAGASDEAAEDNSAAVSSETYFFTNDSENTVSLGTPDNPLDPGKVYKDLKFTPDMFYGTYMVIGGDSAIEDYKANMEYFKFNEAASGGGGVEREMTVIPYKIESRSYTCKDDKGNDARMSVMIGRFFNEKGDNVSKYFVYSIDNSGTGASTAKKIKLEEIVDIKYNEDYSGIVSYEKKGLTLEYTFEISGLSLTLKKDNAELTLKTGYTMGDEEGPRIVTTSRSYLAEDSNPIDHIVSIDLYKNDSSTLHSIYITFDNDKNEEETSSYACAEMSENGLFTFSVPYATETKTYQYVYLYVNDGSLILTDGTNVHRYTYKEEDFHAYKLGTVLGDDVSVDSLTDEQTKELIVKQNEILIELEKAFEEKKIDAQIDKETGRVTLDSNILFANDSYDLSADGKKSLDDFLDVYTSVVLSDKNKDTVTSIIVEGHTDTNGTEEHNQKLSEDRAKAVADYCIDVQPDLKDKIETVGYAAKNPVYDENGNVDMAASRRVVFKFKLDVKK